MDTEKKMELKDLGFDPWFRDRSKHLEDGEGKVARIAAVHRDNYIVIGETGEVRAELTGKILYSAASRIDLPTVGDWVVVRYYDEGALAIIHDVLPRRTVLRRKVAGKTVDYQPLAANIDTAFIIQSADRDFNLRRLERYLVMVRDGGIRPVILLSKSDLIDKNEIKRKLEEIRKTDDKCDVIAFSNIDGRGMKTIRDALEPSRTYCLLGSSGVGKTTLLNKLIGEERFVVAEVREKSGKGKHVTTARQLIRLPNGSLIIDTPGMRELGIFGVDEGLEDTFDDIHALAQDCRYTDCTHTHEVGCAVRKAVEENRLDAGRYESYQKIRKESEYYSMSYLEKRRRDKSFGKMCKAVMKNNKKA